MLLLADNLPTVKVPRRWGVAKARHLCPGVGGKIAGPEIGKP